jgi:hypothetical protein
LPPLLIRRLVGGKRKATGDNSPAKKPLKSIAPLDQDSVKDALRDLSRIRVRLQAAPRLRGRQRTRGGFGAESYGEIFQPLKDMRVFRTARLNPDLDTVVWSNSADRSPDFLYEIGQPASSKRRAVHHVAESRARYRAKR